MPSRKLLTDEQLAEELNRLSNWRKEGTLLTRTIEFPSFPKAIQVINRVAEVAESADHHPDIDVRWRTLTFYCVTHSSGGITELDLALARDIDAIVNEFL